MRIAELTTPFLRFIPKGESPEHAYFTLDGGKLIYSGTRAFCVLEPFLPGVSATLTYKDIQSVSMLDSPQVTRDGHELTFKDSKTNWKIYAAVPTPGTFQLLELPQSLTFSKVSDSFRRALTLCGMKAGDISVDAYNYNGKGYIAAISQSIAMSLSSDDTTTELNISTMGDIISAAIAMNSEVATQKNMMYFKTTLKGGETITSAVKFNNAHVMDKAKELIYKLHNGDLETDLIVSAEIPYDELRETVGIIERMDNPTSMVMEIGSNAAKVTVAEMHGREFTRTMQAATSTNAITFQSRLLNSKVLQFLSGASTTKTSDLAIRINVMPKSRYLVLRPVVSGKIMNDCAVMTRVQL